VDDPENDDAEFRVKFRDVAPIVAEFGTS